VNKYFLDHGYEKKMYRVQFLEEASINSAVAFISELNHPG